MHKKAIVALSVLAVAFTSLGCGNARNNNTANPTTGAGTTSNAVKVGLVTDIGGLNDNGFNHLADVGLNNAEQKLGVQGKVVESKQATDYTPNLSYFATHGYNLVIAVGFLMHDAVEQVAKQYPNTHFMIIDDVITDRANVVSAVFRSEQAGYLAGAMAGLIEKGHALPNLNSQNVVGVIGGQESPPVDSYIAGFRQGFKREDPTGKVLVSYTNSFTDASLGTQFAQNQMSQGKPTKARYYQRENSNFNHSAKVGATAVGESIFTTLLDRTWANRNCGWPNCLQRSSMSRLSV